MVSVHNGSACLRYAVVVLAGFFPSAAIAADVACPVQIDVSERLVSLPEAWSPIAIPNTKRDLHGVEFTERGEEDGTLSYDDEIDYGVIHVYSYWFPDKNITYRVICSYEGTHVELIKDLPQNTRKCDVIFTTTQSGTLLFKKAICS